jgi:hydrophobic/amphiphilic exporter-1 (mainly G- bacteria), HAE1 family
VIFLFLLDWRATIIPAVTIPVSLIGTFAFIKLFGFSINSLTLFGITLATGLVVDDAIVVIENVQRHIAMEHSDPHEATSHAMGEVTSAVIATSLVLIAVFVPVSFFPRHHRHSLPAVLADHRVCHRHLGLQRADAFAGAVGHVPARRRSRPKQLDFSHIRPVSRAFAAFIHGADATVSWLVRTYGKLSMSRCGCATCCCCCFLCRPGATVWIYQRVPTGFIPQEDQGYLLVIVQAPPGSSLTYTSALADRAEAIIATESRYRRLLLHDGLRLFRRRFQRRA